MKYKRFVFMVLLLLTPLIIGNVKAFAMTTGFSTEPLPQDKVNVCLDNINLSFVSEEPLKWPIECFDVNKNRLIAIGQDTPNRKTICIYSNEGVFQYGYTFNCSGSFGIEWDEENLNIYFVRSNIIVSVTPNGEILNVCEVQNTSENNSYINHFIHATKRTIGETDYVIKNNKNNMNIFDIFASSYSQLITVDSSGKQSTVYNADSAQLAEITTIFVAALIFISIFISIAFAVLRMLIMRFVNARHKN